MHVEVKPEADATAYRVPHDALQAFYTIFLEWEAAPRLTLPGPCRIHKLRNARNLWTLKLPYDSDLGWRDYRCIYAWTGTEIHILRFGTWHNIYEHLPRERQ